MILHTCIHLYFEFQAEIRLASLDKSSESEAYIIQTMYEDFNDQFISLRIFLLYEPVHFSFIISSYLRHSVEHKGKLISMEVIR